jgi:putative membrane protein insertion efficiency factor
MLLLLTACYAFADEQAALRFIMKHNQVSTINVDPSVHSASFDFFATETNEVKLFFLSTLKFYQLVISSQDQPSCMFTPTCSEYARMAIEKYGLIAGTIMAADRLLRCNGSGRRLYPVDKQTGRLSDPLP